MGGVNVGFNLQSKYIKNTHNHPALLYLQQLQFFRQCDTSSLNPSNLLIDLQHQQLAEKSQLSSKTEMTNLTTFRYADNISTSLRNGVGPFAYSMSNSPSVHPKRIHIPSTVACNLCDATTPVTPVHDRYDNREKGYNTTRGIISYGQSRAMEFSNIPMQQHHNFHSQSSQHTNHPMNRQTFPQTHRGGQLMQSKSHLYQEETEKNYSERYKSHQQFMKKHCSKSCEKC